MIFVGGVVSVLIVGVFFFFIHVIIDEQNDENILDKSHPDFGLKYGPIDVVYTWVNGSDSRWRKEKKFWHQKWLEKHGIFKDEMENPEADDTSNADNRFRDNEELRYSLRSIEMYAPWVRNIYLVTDGQIPSWLNLEAESAYSTRSNRRTGSKLKIMPHSVFFANKSHLPVFSSPSIESNLDLIPGLSEYFLYLNDDVFFGAPVYPEDFITPSGLAKVYLAWEVPECNSGCKHTWLNDGNCDAACNVSSCDFDMSDCGCSIDPKNPTNITCESVSSTGSIYKEDMGVLDLNKCAPECHYSWLGDGSCDHKCNVTSCGMDMGDCGDEDYTNNYDSDSAQKYLKQEILRKNVPGVFFSTNDATIESNSTFHLPTVVVSKMSPSVYLNFSQLLNGPQFNSNTSAFTITNVVFDNKELIRESIYNEENMCLVLLFKRKEINNHAIDHDGDYKENMEHEESGGKKPQANITDAAFFTIYGYSLNTSIVSVTSSRTNRTRSKIVTSSKNISIKFRVLHGSSFFISNSSKSLSSQYLGVGMASLLPQYNNSWIRKGKSFITNDAPLQLDSLRFNIDREGSNSSGLLLDISLPLASVDDWSIPIESYVVVTIQKSSETDRDSHESQVFYNRTCTPVVNANKKDLSGNIYGGIMDLNQRVNVTKCGIRNGQLFFPVLLSTSNASELHYPLLVYHGSICFRVSSWNQCAELIFIYETQNNTLPGVNFATFHSYLPVNTFINMQPTNDLMCTRIDNIKWYNLGNLPQSKFCLNDSLGCPISFHPLWPFFSLRKEYLCNADMASELISLQGNVHRLAERRAEVEAELYSRQTRHLARQEACLARLQKIRLEKKEQSVSTSEKFSFFHNSNAQFSLFHMWHRFMNQAMNWILEKLGSYYIHEEEDWDYSDKICMNEEGLSHLGAGYHENGTESQSVELSTDTFGDSLRHVNKLYTRKFGLPPGLKNGDGRRRRVPSHMPFMFRKSFVSEMKKTWSDEFHATSSHRFRSPSDMQFSFSYFYYVMNRNHFYPTNLKQIIENLVDTNGNGIIDDPNEVYNLASLIAGGDDEKLLEDYYDKVHEAFKPENIEKVVSVDESTTEGTLTKTEKLRPFITLDTIEHARSVSSVAEEMIQRLLVNIRREPTHILMTEDEVTFHMLSDDYGTAFKQLQSTRGRRTKFICINDDMKYPSQRVSDLLHDFFLTMYPKKSRFELPYHLRNRFLHIDAYILAKKKSYVFVGIFIGLFILLVVCAVFLVEYFLMQEPMENKINPDGAVINEEVNVLLNNERKNNGKNRKKKKSTTDPSCIGNSHTNHTILDGGSRTNDCNTKNRKLNQNRSSNKNKK